MARPAASLLRRAALWLGAALICCALLVAAAGAAQAAGPSAGQLAGLAVDPDDALLFDLRVAGLQLGGGVRAYDTAAGLCLNLPDLIDGLNIALAFSADGTRVEGWAFEESRRIRIDRGQGEVQLPGGTARLDPRSIWDSPGGWCVRAADLERWLDLAFDVDLPGAVIGVRTTGRLPIEAALKRAARAERLRAAPSGPAAPGRQVALPYRLWRTPAIDANISFTADRPAPGRMGWQSRYELFAAGEVARMSADMRLISDQQARPQALRLRLFRADPAGRLLGPLRATQVELGDVVSPSTPLTVQATPGRGVALSNRPPGMNARRDLIDFAGPMPVGWDVELYRNGELLRSETGAAAGRYEFRDVELRLGVNDFELVQYGPQGQVRRQRRTLNIGAQVPGAGERWWSAVLVEDRRDLIGWRARPDRALAPPGWRGGIAVEQGLGHGTALALAVHRAPVRTGTQGYVEAGLRAGVMRLLGEVNLAAARDGGRALRINVIGAVARTNISLEAIRNRGLTSERLDPSARSVTAIGIDRPVRVAGLVLPLRFDLRTTVSRAERLTEARGRVSLIAGRVAASATLGWRRAAPRLGPARDEAVMGLLVNGRMGRIRLRGEMDWAVRPRPELVSALATANLAIGPADELQLTTGYAGRERAGFAGANYTRDFGILAASFNAQANSRGVFSLGLSAQFSFGPGGDGRFGRFRSGSRATGGALAVSAFSDLNGDGVRQPGEPAVPVGGLIVDGAPLDAPDRAATPAPWMIDGLDPAVPVQVALDPARLADPFDAPGDAGVAAVPRAGLVTPVELAIVRTATVDGTLARAGRPLAGEEVALVDRQGVVVHRLRTEFDGYFSFERVKLGQYQLRLLRGGTDCTAEPIVIGPERLALRLGLVELARPPERLARR